jgi:hypothetical protein
MPAATLEKSPQASPKGSPAKTGKKAVRAREVGPPDIKRSLGNSYLQTTAGGRELLAPPETPEYGGNGTAQPNIVMHVSGEGGPFKKASTEPTAGGITGISLDVTFTVSNTPATSLQAVQVFWGTTGTEPGNKIGGRQFGSMSWVKDSKTYGAFVDGGKESPYVKWSGNSPAHATQPYYLTAAEVASNVTFSKDSGTIKVTDTPTAVGSLSEANFETAIVAVNYNNTGDDKVLKVFDWGWTGKGTTSTVGKGTEIAGKDSGILVKGTYSPTFSSIVKHDYPSYTLA